MNQSNDAISASASEQLVAGVLERAAQRFPLGEVKRDRGAFHAALPSLARPNGTPQLWLEMAGGVLQLEVRSLLRTDPLEAVHAIASIVLERERIVVKACSEGQKPDLIAVEGRALPLIWSAVSRPLSAGAITGYLLLMINRHFHAISAACDEDAGEISLRGSCSNPQDNQACDAAIGKILFAAEFATSCVRFVQRVLEPWQVELQAAHAAVLKQRSDQEPPKRTSKKRAANAMVTI